jgi:hypothetical protein
LNAQTNTRTMANLMVGIVTDNNDPSGWGRVRVKLPALTEEHASYWPGLSALEQDQGADLTACPKLMMKCWWGLRLAISTDLISLAGFGTARISPLKPLGIPLPTVRSDYERSKPAWGHTLQFVEEDKGGSKQGVYLDTVKGHHFYCNDSDEVIETKTAGSHQVKLDDKNKKILVQTSGGQKLAMSDSGGKKITLSTSGSIEISAAQGITLKCGANKIDITTSGITIQSSGTLSVKGMTTSVEGTATTAVEKHGRLECSRHPCQD